MASSLIIPIVIKRGTSEKVKAYTGKEGELVYDTTGKRVYVMDGSTKGGKAVGSEKTSELTNDSRFVSTETNGDLKIKGNISASGVTTTGVVSTGTISATGNITSDGEMTCNTINILSDKTRKENLERVSSITLDSLTPYTYNFIGEEKSNRKIGLIAQDVEKIAPLATSKNAEGCLTIDYNAIVALLVGKVNELEKRIAILENRL